MKSPDWILYAITVFFLLLIIGTFFKWKILVDPPEEWSKYYSQSLLNKMFGSDFLIWFNYILGFVGLLFCLLYMFVP